MSLQPINLKEVIPKQGQVNLDTYSSFNPRIYLDEYYSTVGQENSFLLKFYHDIFENLPAGLSMFELGGGPTIYQLLSASKKVKSIVFSDYLQNNLAEVAGWLVKDHNSFSWRKFSFAVAELEGAECLQSKAIEIEERTRNCLEALVPCDALLPSVSVSVAQRKFDILSSSFCLECISKEENEFVNALFNAKKLLEPKGYLLLTMLKNSSWYQVADRSYPSVPINDLNLLSYLNLIDFEPVEYRESNADNKQGYDGIIAALAVKRG